MPASETPEPAAPLISSFALTLMLGVVAISPSIPAPVHAFALSQPFSGTWFVYVGSVVGLTGWLIRANKAEEKRRAWEQDRAHQAQADEIKAHTQTTVRHGVDEIKVFVGQMVIDATTAKAAVQEQSGSAGLPLIQQFDALIAERGAQLLGGWQWSNNPAAARMAMGTDEFGFHDGPPIPLFAGIRDNPPKTPKEVSDAIALVSHARSLSSDDVVQIYARRMHDAGAAIAAAEDERKKRDGLQ